MCQNSGVLILLLLFKLIVLIVIPVTLIVFRYKRFENYTNIFVIEYVLIMLLIAISFVSPKCISNSSIFRINRISIYNENDYEILKENNDVNIVTEIFASDDYKTSSNDKVYYFNNMSLPLSDMYVRCDNKDLYMKNIGNNITSVSTLLSTGLQQNIDPIELLKLSVDKNILDCEKGVSTEELLNVVSNEYNVNFKVIDKTQVPYYINTGTIVLEEITSNKVDNKISCDDSTIILYKINNEGKYNILNPSDRGYDYICPSNTAGYGNVLKANSNELSWDTFVIENIGLRYIIIEK